MSQENGRRFGRRSWPSISETRRLGWRSATPASELLDDLSLNPNIYRGHDQVAAWFRGWEKVWTDMRFSGPEDIRDEGNLIVWRSTARARGRQSGVEVSQNFWHVMRFRRGLMIRIEAHRTEADALEAAGLSE